MFSGFDLVHLLAPGGQLAFLAAGFGLAGVLILTVVYIRVDLRRRRAQRVRDEELSVEQEVPSRRAPSRGSGQNERYAAVLMVYLRLLELADRYDVAPQEGQTLREFEEALQEALPVNPLTLGDLFEVFESTFYGDEAPPPSLRSQAIHAYAEVAAEVYVQEKKDALLGGIEGAEGVPDGGAGSPQVMLAAGST